MTRRQKAVIRVAAVNPAQVVFSVGANMPHMNIGALIMQ